MNPIHETECANFAHNITWLRQHHGLSKTKMCRLLGIGIGTLNKLEQGIVPPNISTLVLFRVYKHFGISPAEQFDQRLGE